MSRAASTATRCKVPDGWRLCQLGDLAADIFGGGTPSTGITEYWDGDQPWTTTAIIKEDDIYLNKFQRTITRKGLQNSAARVAPTGSVLIGTRVGVGKTVVATFDIAINQDLTALVPTRETTPEFIALALKEPSVQVWFQNNKRGSTIKGVPRKDLASLQILLPPLPEQRGIAYVLRTVQRAKEATEKVITALRELKKSLIRHLFSYGLVPFDQADRVKLKETEIGPVLEEWEVLPLGALVTKTQYGISRRGAESGRYPMLRMNNLAEGRLSTAELQFVDLTQDECRKFRLNVGDVLFNRTNSFELVGKTALFREGGDYVFASYLIRVVSDRDRLDPAYLSYYLNGESTQRRLKFLASRGVSQSNINATKLRGFAIPVPPLAVQRDIASMLSQVDGKLDAEFNAIEGLQALFQSLLHHLMGGKVRVNHLKVSEGVERG